LALIADAIMDCSKRGAIVLDAFAKSGSTLLAAERTGRKGYGIEREPHYIDAIIKRFDSLCGLKAVHIQSSKSFEAMAAARLAKEDYGSQDRKERHSRLTGGRSSGRRNHNAKNGLP
jgi:DNA modification methylase